MFSTAGDTACCLWDVTCETADCTTDCSHRGRQSDSAPLPRSPCSPVAGSTHSASSGPATETHHSGHQGVDGSRTRGIRTSCAGTHRRHLWLRVRPAGSHGAHNASAGIHVKVPPGQDNLSVATRLSRKQGGVGLERAAYWLTEIHTERDEESKMRKR